MPRLVLTTPSVNPYLKKERRIKKGDTLELDVAPYLVAEEDDELIYKTNTLLSCPVCKEVDIDLGDKMYGNLLIFCKKKYPIVKLSCPCCNSTFSFDANNIFEYHGCNAVISKVGIKSVRSKSLGRATKAILSIEKPYKLKGRAITLFGVHIPPKKIFTPKKYLTLSFVLNGGIPSKKNDYFSENNYRFIMNEAFTKPNPKIWIKENIKSWIRGSKLYLEWLDEIDTAFREQMEYWRVKYNLVYPLDFVSIKTTYYFADNTARDIISKDESVFDMLVTKKVIHDDNYSILHKYTSEAANYKNEIPQSIAVICVNFEVY